MWIEVKNSEQIRNNLKNRLPSSILNRFQQKFAFLWPPFLENRERIQAYKGLSDEGRRGRFNKMEHSYWPRGVNWTKGL